MSVPNFLVQALKMADRGIPVSFFHAGEKGNTELGWQNLATASAEEIVRRVGNDERKNYGCVAKAVPNGFVFLDDDGGIREEYEQAHGPLVPTLKVRSCNGSFHYYFKHSAASLAYHAAENKAYIGEAKYDEAGRGELWSLRMNNAYVVGPGSVVPNKQGVDSEYQVVFDAPIAEIPDTLLTFLTDRCRRKTDFKPSPTVSGDKIPYGQHDTELTRIAGLLRRDGIEEEALAYALMEICEKRCEGYGSDYDQMCKKIAHSICKHPAGTSDGGILFNGKKSGESQSSPAPATVDVSTWRDYFKTIAELESGGVRMLIDGFLPEGTDFIGALSGHGKTWVALSIVKALTTGKPFLGSFNVPKAIPCLYLIPESSGRAFRARAIKFGIPANNPELFLCRTISEGKTLLLNDLILAEAVRKMKPVVFLDTAIRFSTAVDENNALQNKRLVDDIIALRQAGALSVIGIHHSTKSSANEKMTLENALRGTGDLGAMCDAVYSIRRDEAIYNNGNGPNEIQIECVKPRDFEPPKPFKIAATYRKDGGELVSYIDTTGDLALLEPEAVQFGLDSRVINMIVADPGCSRPEIAETLGIQEWTVRKITQRLGWIKSRRTGSKWERTGTPRQENAPKMVQTAAATPSPGVADAERSLFADAKVA
jgi:hypothetical protein